VQRLIRDYPRFFKHIPYFKGRIKLARDAVGYVQNFFRDRVNEHRRELKDVDPSTPPTDFVMAFIQEWNRREQSGERHYFSEQQLVVLLFDLWVCQFAVNSLMRLQKKSVSIQLWRRLWKK
jgi:hypothetical protein